MNKIGSPGATLLFAAFACCGLLQQANGQFVQQGGKLSGAPVTNPAQQGYAVDVSADGNTAIVGAPLDNHDEGGAYIWIRSGGTWSQQGPKLVGSGAIGGAQQGYSVALSADGNTAIVGGSHDNGLAGAAWVWTRSGADWTQQGGKLVGSGAASAAGQGVSVALSADGNTALVGGPLDNSSAGAVWVWTRSSGVWTQQGLKLVGSSASDPAEQGWSVALSEDGNTAAVGAFSDSNGAGAAWIFTRSAGVWSQQGSKLVGSGAMGAGFQGYSIALSGNGSTVLIGAPLDNSGVGAVWAWTRSGSLWTQQGPKFLDSTASNPAYQGVSISLSSDGGTALVGGHNEGSNTGGTRVWNRNGGTWIQQGPKLLGTGATGAAGQGISVALSADADTAIVGAYADANNTGAVWVFTHQYSLAPVSANPAFGSSLAQTIAFTFSDPNGWQHMTISNILINRSLDGRQACYIAFAASGPDSGTVYLVNDAGAAGGPFQVLSLPSSGSINNSQCAISGTGSSVAGNGNNLTLSLSMTFQASFAGNKIVYMAARDSASNNSGWRALGVWNVPGPPPAGPAVSGVTPGRANTATQTYTFTFTDTNGYLDLSVLNILTNGSIDGRNACYLAYLPSSATTGTLLLVNDAGAAGGPFESLPIPGPGTIQNSQCSISGVGSSTNAAGNSLTLTLPITFKPSFQGNRIMYGAARNNATSSDWQAISTILVP